MKRLKNLYLIILFPIFILLTNCSSHSALSEQEYQKIKNALFELNNSPELTQYFTVAEVELDGSLLRISMNYTYPPKDENYIKDTLGSILKAIIKKLNQQFGINPYQRGLDISVWGQRKLGKNKYILYGRWFYSSMTNEDSYIPYKK